MNLLHRIGLKSKILSYLPISIQASKEEWDLQYSMGGWEYLNSIRELAHYSIIAGYCAYLQSDGAILDIGCGEGILAKRLPLTSYSSYVGIDISQEAITRAEKIRNEKMSFIRADVANYEPTRSFDLIVFNESLYCLRQPMDALRRYADYRDEKGNIIVSMVSSPHTKRIWKAIRNSYNLIDETYVRNRKGIEWVIRVY